MMKILVVHNYYQHSGGEDSVVATEVAMLRNKGHDVAYYERHNSDIPKINAFKLAKDTVWSSRTVNEILDAVKYFKPDVMHVHNTFPLISPSVYQAAYVARIPIIQTLHNFRLICPQAIFLRNGQVCEDCLGKIPWRAIGRRCYRRSVAQTAVLTGMLMYSRARGIYQNKVTRYIALSEFSLSKYIQGGLPAERLRVKPNFVADLAVPDFSILRQDLLFVGRLSEEKGLSVLSRAFDEKLHGTLRVAGAGPESDKVSGLPGVKMLGAIKPHEVRTQMDCALALVLPSICYENMPMTLLEAYSAGLPVIASRLGALAGLVEDGVTGLLFEAGSAEDLQAKLTWAVNNPQAMLQMGRNARALYLDRYTPDKNYADLMQIYQGAIDELKGNAK